MNYYAYVPTKEGLEPTGTDARLIINGLKTIKGVQNRCKVYFGNNNYKLFSYTNFYNEKTFKEIK